MIAANNDSNVVLNVEYSMSDHGCDNDVNFDDDDDDDIKKNVDICILVAGAP